MERRALIARLVAAVAIAVLLLAGTVVLANNGRSIAPSLPSHPPEPPVSFWAWQPADAGVAALGPSVPARPLVKQSWPAEESLATPTPPAPPPLPLIRAALPADQPPPSDLPFPGNLLIADASNHRLLEVTPDRRVVWSFPPRGGPAGAASFRFPDDAFFSPDGRYVAVSEESNQTVVVIDYQLRQVVWQYGEPGHAGSDLRHLSNPDDARILPDGRIAVADIRNCRILLISWDQRTVQALGRPGDCSGRPGSFAEPNGIEPLPNGHLLISEIRTRRVSEIDLEGRVVRAVTLPVHYPSDPFLTSRDTLIVADYHSPGRVIEADWQGHVLWSYPPAGSVDSLNRTSIAMELPNGNIAICDDHRHRVLIVDRSGRTVWQYGVKDVAGGAPGYLMFPDGFDLHLPAALAEAPAAKQRPE